MPAYSSTDLIINRDGSVYHLNLKPENLAKKIITVGDPSRVHKISRHFDEITFEMNRREFITHTGTYKGKEITAISSGMGTDNVEILMTELDALVNVDLKKREPLADHTSLEIVRVGTSGSIQEDLRLGSHLISEYAIGLDTLGQFYNFPKDDFEATASESFRKETGLGFTPYCVKGSEILLNRFASVGVKGFTATCPGFYAPQGRITRIPAKYENLMDQMTYFHHQNQWLTNIEMETAGYYLLARLFDHEALSLNAIIANRTKGVFSKDPDKVIDSLIKKTLDLI